MSDEPREHRLKRLHMRSMRRGIKEMDLILSTYAGRHLSGMTDAQLDTYDAMLNENDQDLYRWVTGQEAAPDHIAALIEDVSRTFQPEK
ncbi:MULTISPECIES: succinate dehydrogenase assembly factor 2 [Roseobacteraceae]|uniref:succinate dehydrogenase assembly factor 2 n=1 Tax=Roseobacteraceae TaxID=2854170 RepID=UPI001C46F295|nr:MULTISPECIES: succinate dehydrogenase assembly factor 2 [Roseobacteraceae]MBV7408897.1 succinate dehydrogenase assembly factor 2 [Maritimibacter sp. DP1N21-5]MBY5934416.1 succinate dehydrogenase assembly factor 2 [Tateyamaria omphalii]